MGKNINIAHDKNEDNMLCAYFSRLTISTELSLTNNMILIDVNGYPHDLTPYQVRTMITIGWIAFFSSWTMNILFYAVHPSAVDFNLERLRDKCYIYKLSFTLVSSSSSFFGDVNPS